jgi:hypothetical protein
MAKIFMFDRNRLSSDRLADPRGVVREAADLVIVRQTRTL